jgi:hypothetical protein
MINKTILCHYKDKKEGSSILKLNRRFLQHKATELIQSKIDKIYRIEIIVTAKI